MGFDHSIDALADVGERWTAAMLRGDFEAAWRETDRIEKRRRAGVQVSGALLWDGSDFRGKTVLLASEHGLGDAIQFLRYGPLLRRQCARLILKAQDFLLPLFRDAPWLDASVGANDTTPPHDVAIEVMELPYAFRSTCDHLPAEVPYIAVPGGPPLRCHRSPLHVGLCWASGPWNCARSIPLPALNPLGDIPGIVFHSLQWGAPAAEAWTRDHRLRLCNKHEPTPVDLVTLGQTVAQMDLVISVDTMVAHMAGALAKPVWVLLLRNADWRWMTDRQDSPWYPTMRLFRQSQHGDWSRPVAELARALQMHNVLR